MIPFIILSYLFAGFVTLVIAKCAGDGVTQEDEMPTFFLWPLVLGIAFCILLSSIISRLANTLVNKFCPNKNV